MANLSALAWSFIPRKVRCILRERLSHTSTSIEQKYVSELRFWERYVEENGPGPEKEYYRKFMMDMGGIENEGLFSGRICLDIGCGPMGSLSWLRNARLAIGLDPLAEAYRKFGIERHEMLYIVAPAEKIPLPTHYVDLVFSMNSLDHVSCPLVACTEIRRVLKPSGFFIGSINLDEPPTLTEPWTLTEGFLEEHLFAGWEREFYKIRPKVNNATHFGPYKYFYEDCPRQVLESGGPRALWCRYKVQ